jgi:urease beta subunit
MKPGEYFLEEADIVANQDRNSIELEVSNGGDRPVQVGSHFHFFEVNRCLQFEREKAYGMRLNIPSGTSVRFEPGQRHRVTVCPIGGARIIHGFNRLVEGALDDENVRERAMAAVKKYCNVG